MGKRAEKPLIWVCRCLPIIQRQRETLRAFLRIGVALTLLRKAEAEHSTKVQQGSPYPFEPDDLRLWLWIRVRRSSFYKVTRPSDPEVPVEAQERRSI